MADTLAAHGLATDKKIGFGCMGITAFYGDSMQDDAAVALVKGIYDAGCRHFDTAEIYRQPLELSDATKWNEQQVGNFLRTVPRDSFTLATKYHPLIHDDGGACTKAGVLAAVDASLTRLGLEYIDLYYLHRMPATVEQLESWVTAMAEAVKAGKVRHLGLSEAAPEWIRRAHAIHPISAVQQEWSLLTRNLEAEVVPVCKELDIAVVAYSPLARNLLALPEEAPTDWRASLPRYNSDNFEENKKHVGLVKTMAEAKGKTAAQLSLAWLYHQAAALGVTVLPIPGTTKLAHAKDNIAALDISLTDAEAAELATLADLVKGARGDAGYLSSSLEGQVEKLAAAK